MSKEPFVLSYSGGKDSVLALDRAVGQGLEPVGLVTTYNVDLERSWFHGIPQPVLESVGRSLGLPITLLRTTGEAYRDNFLRYLQARREEGVRLCAFGDIDIPGHLEWCTRLCRDADMEAVFPLWQEPREALVREFLRRGYRARLTVVDTTRLSREHLGRQLTEAEMAAIREEGADVCGENGEYHTFVSAGPLFRQRVAFRFGPAQQRGDFAVLPLLET